MGQLSFEQEVYNRLQGKSHLQPVFSGGCYDICRRLREYDPGLFIVWHTMRKKYEVHSLNHIGNTYGFDVPGNRLDARIEHLVRKFNIRTRGLDEIIKEIDEHNEKQERAIKNRRQDEIKAAAEDMQPAFKKVAWGEV